MKSSLLCKDYLACCKQILEENPVDENMSFKRSLPICILDAVYSIGARYSSTRRVWERYMKYYHLDLKCFCDVKDGETDYEEHTISDFLQNFKQFSNVDAFVASVLKNRQRTSPRNGILKAQAVIEVAQIMKDNSINTVNDFRTYSDKETLEAQILSVRGQGSGIMLKYLYMLTGDANTCKPDRWLHRFCQSYYPEIQIDQIQSLMSDTIVELIKTNPNVTVRMLDNAIWKHEKQLSRRRKSKKTKTKKECGK